MKLLFLVLISIALLSAAYFSGPILVLVILVSTLVYFALRGLYRAMDVNKDGKVNFDDLRHLLGAQDESPATPEDRAREARSFMDRRSAWHLAGSRGGFCTSFGFDTGARKASEPWLAANVQRQARSRCFSNC